MFFWDPLCGTRDHSPIRRMATRQRILGFQVSLSLPRILRVSGEGDRAVNGVARVLDFYAMPLVSIALMKDLNGRTWFARPAYRNASTSDFSA